MEISKVANYLKEKRIVDPQFLSTIKSISKEVSFKKKSILIEEGDYHNYVYYLMKGSVRSFTLKRGKEVVNWFALEQEWIGSIQNYQGSAAIESIEFLEDSNCLQYSIKELRELQLKDMEIASFIFSAMEYYAVFMQDRLLKLQHIEALERYEYLLAENPEYISRIPLKHLASYLDISRETLSRMRRKVIL